MLITRADWLVLIFYFAIVAAIGVAASLRVRGTSEYFLGTPFRKTGDDGPGL